MALTADDARNIAEAFRNVSIALGNYRFSRWTVLSESQRGNLEDDEWTLLNYSSDFTTRAVGLTLNDTKGDLKKLLESTQQATAILQTVATLNQVISVAGAVIKLGAAIISENPATIVSATNDVYSTVTAVGQS